LNIWKKWQNKNHEICHYHPNGAQYWHNEKGQYHREDGPAVIWENGLQEWYNDGVLHREDGPAVYITGHQSWYLNDNQYTDNKTFQLAANLSDEDMLAMILKYGNVK
jgi:hypothetical protein